MHHLVGYAEIMAMLRVSRQRVHQLTQRSDFPEPVAKLAAGWIWERDAVEAWAQATGRPREVDGGEDDPASDITRCD